MKSDFIEKLIKIEILVMFHISCEDINLYSLYMSNARDGPPKYIKYYSHNFFKETSI